MLGIRGTRKSDRRIPRKRIISVALTLIIALSIVSTAFAGSVSFWFNTWLYGNDNNRYHTLDAGKAILQMTYRIDPDPNFSNPYRDSKKFLVRLYRERWLITDKFYGERSPYTATRSYKTSYPSWTVDANSSKYYLVFGTVDYYDVTVTGTGNLYNP